MCTGIFRLSSSCIKHVIVRVIFPLTCVLSFRESMRCPFIQQQLHVYRTKIENLRRKKFMTARSRPTFVSMTLVLNSSTIRKAIIHHHHHRITQSVTRTLTRKKSRIVSLNAANARTLDDIPEHFLRHCLTKSNQI